MKTQIAAAVAAGGMLAGLGLAQLPASASTSTATASNPKVGETVFKGGRWHKYEATYLNLPTHIQLIEPDGRAVVQLTWNSWTATGGLGNGTLHQANGCCGVPAAVQVTRPRDGHFTRLSIFPQTSTTPMKFWWPATVLKTSRLVWQGS